MDDAERVKALEALYAELPTIDCQRKCSSYCTAIWMSRVEWDRVKKRSDPKQWKATEFRCPMLDRKGNCTVHTGRPMICRLWGLSEAHPCDWGCQPSRVLSLEETREFMRRSWELGA